MFPDEQLGNVFALLTRIADAFVATAGPHAEVVVHDLRDPEHTVVAISGNLTHRVVGSPVPEPALLPDRVDQFTDDTICERVVTPFGKELLSSTVWVRDQAGHIVGALCINMDFSDLRMARDIIGRAIVDWPKASPGPSLVTFATTADEFAEIALRDVIRQVGKPLHHLDREDKIFIVRELDLAGVFNMRGAVDTVANELGVSRASVYSYLNAARATPDAAVSLT